jgi:hypothetical protein
MATPQPSPPAAAGGAWTQGGVQAGSPQAVTLRTAGSSGSGSGASGPSSLSERSTQLIFGLVDLLRKWTQTREEATVHFNTKVNQYNAVLEKRKKEKEDKTETEEKTEMMPRGKLNLRRDDWMAHADPRKRLKK